MTLKMLNALYQDKDITNEGSSYENVSNGYSFPKIKIPMRRPEDMRDVVAAEGNLIKRPK